jgi:selenocysteine lyase/cysteine desulfurase
MIAEARAAMGDFLNCDADEIVFGPNMTTLTFAMSRALGRELGPGDEIVLTLLDHDANFSPWKALEEKGVVIRTVKFQRSDCTLDMHDLASKIGKRTQARGRRLCVECGGHDQQRRRSGATGAASGSPELHRCRPLRSARPD